MKPETLERLLIDRACGELSEDVLELLEAQLAAHPEMARDIDDTVALARRALQPARPHALPPPRFVVKPTVSWRVPIWAVGMAACFAAGAILTWAAARSGMTGARSQTQIAQISAANEPPNRTHVIWESPVRMPVIQSKL